MTVFAIHLTDRAMYHYSKLTFAKGERLYSSQNQHKILLSPSPQCLSDKPVTSGSDRASQTH